MRSRVPSLSLGIEEEYLLVDPATRDLVSTPDPAFIAACKDRLGDRVSRELLQAQVEVGTPVCPDIGAARRELGHLRGTVARIARDHGMALVAASTHPTARWTAQQSTDDERYQALTADFQVLVRRQVISGMHIHAAVEDEDLRIDLMNQVGYFLPHLLALSTSSPFWRGEETGLKAVRPTIANDLPRSGTPERFASWREWQLLLDDLAGTGLCDDPTKIWWDVRPSARYPTLELRLTDICTELEDALTVAALYQSLLHHLWRLRQRNLSWRAYRPILIEENKWRAQRWGVEAELADLGAGRLKPMRELIEELVALLGEDADELGCRAELERAREIVANGTSADRQLATFRKIVESGGSRADGHRAVVDWLVQATVAGLAVA
jgi:glutamate---cysteine ligase / carboxylate-amine ligase